MFAQRSRGISPPVVVLVAVVAVVAGFLLSGPVKSLFGDANPNDKILDQVMGLLQRDYYRPINRSQLVNTGLAAAVASLNDPYSHYFDRQNYLAFQNEDDPHLSGIGVSVDNVAQGLLVREVFPSSPAAGAGLSPGDLITEVGSTSLAGRSQTAAAALIKGRAGTRVTLTVITKRHRRVVSLTRANVSVPITTGQVLPDHGRKIGVVSLSTFSQGSGDELRGQVDKVLHQGAQAIVLDLRENGGGLLEEAVNVASIFIPDGTIVSTAGRSQPRQVYLAKGGAISPKIPVVVLVDHGTASAAEIVTGALQDRGRAKVIGTHTYGKGVFQEIEPLPNGGALDFTVGEYFTPSGRNLGGGGVRRGAGISPTIYAFTSPTAKTDSALHVAERTVASEIP